MTVKPTLEELGSKPITFEEYLGFDPLFDPFPDNWYTPVTIFFKERIMRDKQASLPYTSPLHPPVGQIEANDGR